MASGHLPDLAPARHTAAGNGKVSLSDAYSLALKRDQYSLALKRDQYSLALKRDQGRQARPP